MLIVQPGDESTRKAPDFEEFIKTMNNAQIAFMTNMLTHAAQGDYGVVEEWYMWMGNHWNDNMTPEERTLAAGEATERFFTEKAYDRYQEQMKRAGNIAKESEGLIWTPEKGNGHGKKR
jgi:hypothetical protein